MARERKDVMKISRNGQVSLPAETRQRWDADRVLVVDMGDYVIMRPYPDDPIGSLWGKYAGRGPSAEEMRRIAREEDDESELRNYGEL